MNDDTLSLLVLGLPTLGMLVLMALAVRKLRDRRTYYPLEGIAYYGETLVTIEWTSTAPWHHRVWNLATNPWRYLFVGKWRL